MKAELQTTLESETKFRNHQKKHKSKIKMEHNQFDNEYYVMSMDGASNHPLLAWGNANFEPFLEAEPIDETAIEIPLKIVFGEPFPKEYEIADLLMLDANFAGSEKLKNFFIKKGIWGIQFIPVEIKSNKGEIINGHYAIHFWNRLPAIDKNNYEGSAINRFGKIFSLKKFSLDQALLDEIPLEKRLIFQLEESDITVLVHQSIYEVIKAENLAGLKFFRVDEWDGNAMFR